MKNAIIAAAVLSSLAGAANAQVFYNWDTQTGSRYNPASATTIAFDDVFFSNTLLGGNTAVTLDTVTVGIRRLGGAVATDVSIWAAPMIGTDLTTPAAVGTPVLLGTVSLAARIATDAVTELVSVNSTVTMALNSLIAGATPNFSGLFIGVQLSNVSTANGWRVVNGGTVGSNFTDRFYTYNTVTQLPAGPVAFAAPTPSAFMVSITGTAVPTPGAAALLGLGGLAAFRRRR